ncbi:amidophosphoribosyltransferase [Oscillatoriales cyanobacterium USR001]|nr:amidophosphoribosyltransferase [Oscillatoriales cyanobacterium USR001]
MDKHRWFSYFKPFLSLFLKSSCSLCDRTAQGEFCQYCQKQLLQCQFTNKNQFWLSEKPVFIWGQYQGVLKRAIAAFKYENHPEIAKPLGYWLAESWLNYPELAIDKLTVVPIPLHADKLKKRGFNQAELLAESFCQLTGLPLQRQGLERVKNTKALFDLSVKERQNEMKEALILGKDFRRRHPSNAVLLVDDIYTSGTTIKSATETLNRAGIKVYGTVAIATTKKC